MYLSRHNGVDLVDKHGVIEEPDFLIILYIDKN